jgi:hypothetical protein
MCGRPVVPESTLCHYHQAAHLNLKEGYIEWKRRTSVEWDDYLEVLYNLETLGNWVREVIDFLMSQNDSSELL